MSQFILDLHLIEDNSINKPKAKKASKYDSIIDAFVTTNDGMAEVIVDGIDVYYLRSQLKRRITDRYLDGLIDASVIDKKLYLIR
jgi:hypothetical protein